MDAAKSTDVRAPEPQLEPHEMIARARALRPMVRAEADAAERARLLLRSVAPGIHQGWILPLPTAATLRRL